MLAKIKSRSAVSTRSASLKRLEDEMRRLRSLAISVAGQDEEGSYHPEFVETILKASAEKPESRFTNATDFLKQVSDL